MTTQRPTTPTQASSSSQSALTPVVSAPGVAPKSVPNFTSRGGSSTSNINMTARPREPVGDGGPRTPTASLTSQPSTQTPSPARVPILFPTATPPSGDLTIRVERVAKNTAPSTPPRNSMRSSSSSGTPQPTPPSSSSFEFEFKFNSPNSPAASLRHNQHSQQGLSLRPLLACVHDSSAPEAVPVVAELAAAPVHVFGSVELSTTPAPIQALPVVVPAASTTAAPSSATPAAIVTAAAVPVATTAEAAPDVAVSPTCVSTAPTHPAVELPASPVNSPICEYDPRVEAKSQRVFFTPTVQNALRDGMRLAKEAVAAIEQIGAETIAADADLQRLLADAKQLQVYQSVQTRTIAVLGSSGTGKSHLINCLLHVPNLALSIDIGDACTSIVTEYRQKRQGQTAPYVVEVEYLSAEAIRDHVRELVRSYRRWYLLGNDESGAAEDDARFEKESRGAWSALSTVFGDRLLLTEPWLQDMADGAESRIVATLQSWADAIVWPAGSVGGSGNDGKANVWTATAADAAACAAQTMRFMGDRHWPFTKIIRVYLSAALLEAGIVLADLPGLEDVNLARMRATQDYLTRCDNILIVDHIERAISKKSVQSSIFLALSRHVPAEWATSGGQKLNLAVVCTRSENVNVSAAATWFPDRARLDQLHAAIAAAKHAGDRETEATKKEEQRMLLMRARNDHVRQGLQKTYAAHMQSRRTQIVSPAVTKTLDVFCVSNTWYEAACADGNTAAVQASQIPALRHYCYDVAADDQLAEAKHYLRVRLPALITGLSLWATSAQARQRADATSTQDPAVKLDDLLQHADVDKIHTITKDFEDAFRLLVQDIVLFFANLLHTWTRKAADESRKWTVRKGHGRWHYMQYHAWCARNGDHETSVRRANWNAAIIWAMRQDLEFQWDLTLEQAEENFDKTLDRTCMMVLPLKDAIAQAATATSCPEAGTALQRLIDLKLADLKAEGAQLKRTFLSELRAIHRYTSEVNCASYIVQDMAPVYHKALVDSVHLTGNARRDVEEAVVDGHIRSGRPFRSIEGALRMALANLLRNTNEQLQQILTAVFYRIQQDVRVAFGQLEQTLAAVPPTRHDEAQETRMGALADEAKRLATQHGELLRMVARI